MHRVSRPGVTARAGFFSIPPGKNMVNRNFREEDIMRTDRIARNAILIVGIVLVIGGTAVKSISTAIVVTGVILSGAAMLGMWLTRNHKRPETPGP